MISTYILSLVGSSGINCIDIILFKRVIRIYLVSLITCISGASINMDIMQYKGSVHYPVN